MHILFECSTSEMGLIWKWGDCTLTYDNRDTERVVIFSNIVVYYITQKLDYFNLITYNKILT